MLSIPYTTLVLAAGVGSLLAAATAAESYDLTNCGASTVTTVSATEELTVLTLNWSRSSEQQFRVDKWSLCRG
jgi:hypothetical protein